jgi:hypothetical protein
MKINFAEIGKDILLAASVMGLIYGVAVKSGYVMGRAEAQEMVQQNVYEEALDRERADLQFQIDMATMKLKFLAEKPARSEFDNMELDMLQKQIGMLQERLSKLDAPQ